ncbi:hypothetical protein EDB84DRAFT_1265604, partial [Lactarius hengduanensis]
FNSRSLLVNLLLICACTYVRAVALRLIDNNKQGCVFSFFRLPQCEHANKSTPSSLSFGNPAPSTIFLSSHTCICSKY